MKLPRKGNIDPYQGYWEIPIKCKSTGKYQYPERLLGNTDILRGYREILLLGREMGNTALYESCKRPVQCSVSQTRLGSTVGNRPSPCLLYYPSIHLLPHLHYTYHKLR